MYDGCEECCDACFCAHGSPLLRVAAVLGALQEMWVAGCYWRHSCAALLLHALVDLRTARASLHLPPRACSSRFWACAKRASGQ